MRYLRNGTFFGETNKIVQFEGITLTETEYTHAKVDWHYHENPYFTFLLCGNLIEGNRREINVCTRGSLLFHSWQEPHYNLKPDGYTRGFHVEVAKDYFENLSFDIDDLQGGYRIDNPQIRLVFHKIFREFRIDDQPGKISLQMSLLEVFSKMLRIKVPEITKPAQWVRRLRDLMQDSPAENLTLSHLAKEIGIHPVHLSREFPRYFHCSFGEYIRNIRVENALRLLANKKLSLTHIAAECGFSDHSHFIRCFKRLQGVTPSSYRHLLI